MFQPKTYLKTAKTAFETKLIIIIIDGTKF